MKNLKSIVLLSFILVCGISFAQPPGGGQRGGGQQGPPSLPSSKQIKKMVSEISEKVDLSEEQEEKVLELYEEHFEEVDAKVSGSSRPDRSEMEALKSDLEKDVKAEMTKDQIKKYEAYLKTQERQKPQRR
ncbi:hypothetical protein [Carboxylicivirga sp. N1Y90]|uniref:hypothetical protein n=1 Tax=Carboxylicivirga fragile TaxID=3417571 RepID=UPI003D352FE0|nr:hypothetical protein [Marinilabiliaceae bacterium N1Y90]